MPINEPNFDNFVDNWDGRNELVLFLGAGASYGARNRNNETLPTAPLLRDRLWKRLKTGKKTVFDAAALGMLTLEHSTAIIEAKIGRNKLCNEVASLFNVVRPLWQHVVIPYLNPRVMFTTNYDCLVELGWKSSSSQRNPSIEPIFSYDFRNQSRNFLPGHVPLYKPHGSAQYKDREVGNGGLVITQFDYFEMVTNHMNMLNQFLESVENSILLFVGYSFQDMDIASKLYNMRKMNSGTNWYAVFPRTDNDVTSMYFDKYKIRHIDAKFHEFLIALDGHLNFIPDKWKYSNLANLVAEGVVQDEGH